MPGTLGNSSASRMQEQQTLDQQLVHQHQQYEQKLESLQRCVVQAQDQHDHQVRTLRESVAAAQYQAKVAEVAMKEKESAVIQKQQQLQQQYTLKHVALEREVAQTEEHLAHMQQQADMKEEQNR